VNKEELFNLRHASLRNVIERIFGVLKRRFRILLLAPEYSLDIQARIPTALCTIHNFIRMHDGDEGPLLGQNNTHLYDNSDGNTHPAAAGIVEQEEADLRRDQIAEAMWADYQRVCQERGIGEDDSEPEDDDELGDLSEDE
jgi:hypothetical protein